MSEKELEERIKYLEEHWDNWVAEDNLTRDCLEWIQFMVKSGTVEQMVKKISEMEKKDESCTTAISNLWRKLEKKDREIAELKDKFTQHKLNCEHSHKERVKEIDELKSVLKKHFEWHKYLPEECEGDEEMLEEIDMFDNLIKELSGEKDVSVRHGGSSPRQGLVRALTTNSKPDKPILNCQNCGAAFTPFQVDGCIGYIDNLCPKCYNLFNTIGESEPNDEFNQKTYDEGWKQGYKEGTADGIIEGEKEKKKLIAEIIEKLKKIPETVHASKYVLELIGEYQQRLEDHG